MGLWGVQAEVVIVTPDGYSTQYQIPTFFLDSNLHGILTMEGAKAIAERILNPSRNENATVHAWTYKC